MKLGHLAAVAALALAACDCSSHRAIPPPIVPAGADDCDRAAARVQQLGCAVARPDFGTFCRDRLDGGVDIHPACLAAINDCREVDRCR